MGRDLSPERYQQLVEYWHARISTKEWNAVRPADGLAQLATLVGADLGRLTSVQRAMFKTALAELLDAVAAPPDQRELCVRSWIGARLVDRSDRLLIPEERRRALLATIRDGHRRQQRAGSGIHSARIEMPQSCWEKLKRIARRPGVSTLGKALELVIDAHQEPESPKKAIGGGPTPRTDPSQADLFGRKADP